MIKTLKSIYKAISVFFTFMNSIAIPRIKELFSAIWESLTTFHVMGERIVNPLPAVIGTCIGVALIITVVKLVTGRQ